MFGWSLSGSFEEIENRLVQSMERGDFAGAERIAREEVHSPRHDPQQRACLFGHQARALLRMGDVRAALDVSAVAIKLAHSNGAAGTLVALLDLRAEAFCALGDFPQALTTLDGAQRFVNLAGRSAAAQFEADLSQTRGMAYSGCGLWAEASVQLRHAIHQYRYFRQHMYWYGAAGDFALNAIRQAESAPADPATLQQAREALQEILVDPKLPPEFRAKMVLHLLHIRGLLASLSAQPGELCGVIDELWEQWLKLRSDYSAGYAVMADCAMALSSLARRRADTDSGTEVSGTLHRAMSALADLESVSPARQSWVACAEAAMVRGVHLLHRAALSLSLYGQCRDKGDGLLLDAVRALEELVPIIRQQAGAIKSAGLLWGLRCKNGGFYQVLAEAVVAAQASDLRQTPLSRRLILLLEQTIFSPIKLLAQNEGQASEVFERIRWLQHWKEVADPGDSLALLAGVAGSDSILLPHAKVVAQATVARFPDYQAISIYSELVEELDRQQRKFAQLTSVRPNEGIDVSLACLSCIEELQAALRDNEAIIDYQMGPTRAHVCLVTRDTVSVIPLPIRSLGEFLQVVMRRFGLLVNNQIVPSTEQEVLSDLELLGKSLWPAELVERLRCCNVTRLFLVPADLLRAVPFGWLEAGGKLALEQWELCIVPASEFAGSAGLERPLRSAAVFGILNGDEDLLKDVAAVRCSFGTGNYHEYLPSKKESQPVPEVVLDALADTDLVHISSHGVLNPLSPKLSHLKLSPSPERQDGHLTLEDFLSCRVTARLVVLFACFTASSIGHNAMPASLASVLLSAGARCVLATLWSAVNDEVQCFGPDFYQALAQKSDAITAFAVAQRMQACRLRGSESSMQQPLRSNDHIRRLCSFTLHARRQFNS